MKRLLTSAIAAAAMVATAGQAEAQLSANRFGLGVYAGGAYTSDWYEVNDEGYNFGITSAFGGMASYWLSPNFGVRLHYGYIPSEPPTADTNFDDGLPLNNHFYDLDLVGRVNLPLVGALASNIYGFVGGGGLTANIAGEEPPQCANAEALPGRGGLCLPLDKDYATVGQGTVGVGGDIQALNVFGLGAFAELAAHIYDSPVHEIAGFTDTEGTGDKYAVTTRLVLGLKAGFGRFAEPALPPPPPPPPPPVVEAPAMQPIQVCVLEGQQLRYVDAMFNSTTGDTMVMQAGQEQPFSQAYPAMQGYAAGQTFFINNEPVTLGGRRYVKFGLPRVIGVEELSRAGDHQGVQVFTETGAMMPAEVIYLPVRTGCEFQPYQAEVSITPRG